MPVPALALARLDHKVPDANEFVFYMTWSPIGPRLILLISFAVISSSAVISDPLKSV